MKRSETTASSPNRRTGVRRGAYWAWCGCRWALGVLAVGAGLFGGYLNQKGVPDFIKIPILQQLQEHGMDLAFERMRVRLGRGLVADKVAFESTRAAGIGTFRAEEVQLKVDWGAVLRLRPKVLGLRVRGGELALDLSRSNQVAAPLEVNEVQARILFSSSNHWNVEQFSGRCFGARFSATGRVTNLLERIRRPKTSPPSEGWKVTVDRIREWMHGVEWVKEPEILAHASVDLKELGRTQGDVEVRVPGARVRGVGVDVDGFGVRMKAEPESEDGGKSRVSLGWAWDRVRYRGYEFLGVEWTNRLTLERAPVGGVVVGGDRRETNTVAEVVARVSRQWGEVLGAEWRVSMREASGEEAGVKLGAVSASGSVEKMGGAGGDSKWETRWEGRVKDVWLKGTRAGMGRLKIGVEHSWTQWSEARVEVDADGVSGPWGKLNRATVDSRWRAAGAAENFAWFGAERRRRMESEAGLGVWRFLRPFLGNASVRLANLDTPRLQLDDVRGDARWDGARLELGRVELRDDAGRMEATGDLEVASRLAKISVRALYDFHAVHAVMTTNTVRWLEQFGWKREQPPQLEVDVSAMMPAWTNRQVDWKGEVVPGLRLKGRVEAKDVSYRGVPLESAEGALIFTNRVWHLPDMVVKRPEGGLKFEFTGDDVTRLYQVRFESRLDPWALRPMFGEMRLESATNLVQFGEVPWVEGRVWGRMRHVEETGFQGRVSLTNVVVRGELMTRAEAQVGYTNQLLEFRDVRIRHHQEEVTGPWAAVNFAERRLYFTNAVGRMKLERITTMIGPKTAKIMSDYRFLNIPRLKASGWMPLDSSRDSDARFDVDADGLHWWRFHSGPVQASVLAGSNSVTVTNLSAAFYGGRVKGNVYADVSPKKGAIVQFRADIDQADLKPMMEDLLPKTNRLEGRISGTLQVEDAQTWKTNVWKGSGFVMLTDGYLWDMPMFGVFSPALDAITPGWGQSRFRSGTAHFRLLDGKVFSDDLEVRSTAMRLEYDGWVMMDGRMDATMRAAILKDTPILGPMLNLALIPLTKLFEYRVQGTLDKPVAEPLYVPRLLLAPLNPFRSLRDIFGKPGDRKVGAPPAGAESPPSDK